MRVILISELEPIQINPQPLVKGECKMLATVALWCIALFFLWYGLAAFVSALNTDMFKKVGAVLALVGGLASILGMLGM
jgi:hypothetical protein